MSRKTTQYVPLSRLKGIDIYMQDDLYNLARMKLELNDARAKYENSTTISRPTVHGLVNLFARFIDSCNPDHDRVLAAIDRHNFSMNAQIEFDEMCQNGLKGDVPIRIIQVRHNTDK